MVAVRLHLAQDRLLWDSSLILVASWNSLRRWAGQGLLFDLSIGKLRPRRAKSLHFPSLYIPEKDEMRGLLASGLEVLAYATVGLHCFLSAPWPDRAGILMRRCLFWSLMLTSGIPVPYQVDTFVLLGATFPEGLEP